MSGDREGDQRGGRRTRRVYVSELPAPGEPFVLPAVESAHLLKVLRFGPGDRFDAFDGRGRSARCRLENTERKRQAKARVEEELPRADALELPVAVHVLVAPPKGARQEPMVRGLVELGAVHLTPLVTERGWLSPGARVESLHERWLRYGVEACKQCGRNMLPEVSAPTAVIDASPVGDLIVLLDGDAQATLDQTLAAPVAGTIALFLGPEGGFTDAERQRLLNAGARPANLGAPTLRIETAALAAMSLAAVAARRTR